MPVLLGFVQLPEKACEGYSDSPTQLGAQIEMEPLLKLSLVYDQWSSLLGNHAYVMRVQSFNLLEAQTLKVSGVDTLVEKSLNYVSDRSVCHEASLALPWITN